jgi:hypothetical protein
MEKNYHAGGEVQNFNKIELSDFRALFNFRIYMPGGRLMTRVTVKQEA